MHSIYQKKDDTKKVKKMFEAIWIHDDKTDQHTYFYGKYPKKGKIVQIGDNNLKLCIKRRLIDPNTIKYVGNYAHDNQTPQAPLIKLPIEYIHINEKIIGTFNGIHKAEKLLKEYKEKQKEIIKLLRKINK